MIELAASIAVITGTLVVVLGAIGYMIVKSRKKETQEIEN